MQIYKINSQAFSLLHFYWNLCYIQLLHPFIRFLIHLSGCQLPHFSRYFRALCFIIESWVETFNLIPAYSWALSNKQVITHLKYTSNRTATIKVESRWRFPEVSKWREDNRSVLPEVYFKSLLYWMRSLIPYFSVASTKAER